MENQRIFIENLQPGLVVDQIFCVREKELRTTKAGGLFISMKLGDKTGEISAKVWQATEPLFESIPLDGFIQVKGRVEDYRGILQLVAEAFRPWSADHVNLADFLPVSPYDIEDMWSEMLEHLREVKNRHLRRLIKKFLEDSKFVTAYKASPAAVSMHQPYMGGLLEHSLNMVRACKKLLPLYPHLNADLVITAAFLHDSAKSAELTSGLGIHYTAPGLLLGHITLACMWVEEKARKVEEEMGEPFPKKITMLLQHIILSHHGQYDYGSPKLPAVPEAFFLHYIDNLDAKMWMTRNIIESDLDPSSQFTNYSRPLETRIFKHSEHLEGDPPIKPAEHADQQNP